MSRYAYEEKEAKILEYIDEILNELPDFVKSYCYDVERNVLPSSLLAYLRDIKRFFEYLVDSNPNLKDIKKNQNWKQMQEYSFALCSILQRS